MNQDDKAINPGEKWKSYYVSNNLVWENKDYYTERSIKTFIKSEWFRHILSNTKSGIQILEAGCGTGLFSIALSYAGYDVTSIDYNEEAVELAKNNLKLFNSTVTNKLEVKFLQADLLKLDFPDNSFDLVFNQAVLEYFVDDSNLTKAISEMTRVSKKGGKVMAIVQNTSNPMRSLWKLMGIGDFDNQPDVRKINKKILKTYFDKNGLKNVMTDGLYPWKSIFKVPLKFRKSIYYFYRFGEKYIPLPRFLRSRLGIQLVVRGIKK